MAKLLRTSLKIETDYRDPSWREKEEADLEKLQEEARRKAPGDALAGEILYFGVADGSAQYLVTRSKPLTLAHIEIGDGYRVHGALIRGLRLKDVQAQLESARRVRALFAKKTG